MTDNESDRQAIRDCETLRAKARPSAEETLESIRTVLLDAAPGRGKFGSDRVARKLRVIRYIERIMEDYDRGR